MKVKCSQCKREVPENQIVGGSKPALRKVGAWCVRCVGEQGDAEPRRALKAQEASGG